MSKFKVKYQLSNMADVAARREARRRKIIENSHNRLKIISGKSDEDCSKGSPIRTEIPEPDYDIPSTSSHNISTSLPNGVLFNQPELFELLSTASLNNVNTTGSGDGEVASNLAPLLFPQGLTPPPVQPTEVSTSFWDKVIAYKYDIVLLSMFFQFLYGISLITFDNGYFFLPVIVYIVTKLIWFPTQSSSGIANLLILLNGMTPERVQRILFLSQIFGVITRDIFVYLFTTICIQSLCITLRDGLVT